MAAAVVGYATVPARGEIEHLVLECIRGERPAMTEHDRLSRAPVLEIDLCAIFGGDRTHRMLPSRQSEFPMLSTVEGSLSDCHHGFI